MQQHAGIKRSLRRYFLKLAYDGSAFSGFARQQTKPSIQEALEFSLTKIFGYSVPVMGSGRTDVGVHALGQVVHFDAPDPLPKKGELFLRWLSNSLPPSVVPWALSGPHDEPIHARYSACSRHYRYILQQGPRPLSASAAIARIGIPACQKPYRLAVITEEGLVEMNAAARLCLGQHDFGAFARHKRSQKHDVCTVFQAHWRREGLHGLVFDVVANRFLRGMVRAMVGTLLLVGEKKIDLKAFKAILDAKDRRGAGRSVPAHGLYLVAVHYPMHIGLFHPA